MKTSKTITKFFFALTGTALLAACGGGEGQTSFPRASFNISPDDSFFQFPEEGAKNVCRFASMELIIDDPNAWGQDFGGTITVINDDTDIPQIVGSESIRYSQLDDSTLLFFKAPQGLKNNTNYVIEFQPNGNQDPATRRFSTGTNDDNCGEVGRFSLDKVLGFGSTGKNLEKEDFDSFGNRDENGNLNLDFGQVFGNLGTEALNLVENAVFGSGLSLLQFKIEFSQPIDEFSVQNGVRLMIFGDNLQLPLYKEVNLYQGCDSSERRNDVRYIGGANSCIGYLITGGREDRSTLIIEDPDMSSIEDVLDENGDGSITTDENVLNPNLILVITEGVASQRGQFLDQGRWGSISVNTPF